MKNKYIGFLTLLLIAIPGMLWAQIQGTFTVTTGCPTYTYTYNGGSLLTGAAWVVTNGTLNSSSVSGTTYTAVITWTTTGTTTLKFKDTPDGILDTKSITITSGTVAAPTAVSTSFARCGTGTLTLQATPGSGGNSIRWYSASTGGTPLATGTTYTTPSQSTSTTYYFTTYNTTTGCESTPRVSGSTTINSVPGAPTVVSAGSVCGSGAVALSGSPSTGTVAWYANNTTGTVGNGSLATGLSYSPSVSATTIFYMASYNSGTGCETPAASRTPITATVNPLPVITVTARSIFVSTGTNLTVTNTNNISGTTYTFTVSSPSNVSGQSSNGTATAVSQPINQTLTVTDGVNPGSVVYNVTPTGGGCTGTTVAATVNVYPNPVVTSTVTRVGLGTTATLSAQNFYASYTWTRGTATFTGNPLTTSIPGQYSLSVGVGSGGGSSSATANNFVLPSQFSGQNQNYVTSNIMMVATSDTSKTASLPVDSVNQSTDYYDGLGRVIQKVITQGSPLKNDVVQPHVYDSYGREYRKYLPFTAQTNGWFKSGVFDGSMNYSTTGPAANFYNGAAAKVTTDAVYYSQTTFEASPENRPLQDYGAGSSWVTNSKYVAHAYLTNVHGGTTGKERIIVWKVDTVSGKPVRETTSNSFVSGGFYKTGQLNIKSTKDENGNEVREYVDRAGHVILKKVQAVANPILNDSTNWTQTYYVYDNAGLLRYVFQPELTKYIATQGSSYNPTSADLIKLAFQYQYDGRDRMIQKRVPGAGWVYLVYDTRDRLVMTQDSVQRVNKQWLTTKYDTLNRPVMTAIYTHTSVLTQNQMAQLISTSRFCEYYNSSFTTNHGYSLRVFPTSSLSILTVNYYDNYNFITDLTAFGTATYGYVASDIAADGTNGIPAQDAANNVNVFGHPTGARVNVLGSTNYLNAVTYYDGKFRTIQVIAQNNKGGVDRITNVVDFPGRVLKTKTTHSTSTHVAQTIVRRMVYDHMSRVKRLYHTVNANAEVLLVQNDYNEIGQVVTKSLYSTNNGTSFAQNADYRYTIRGWLQRMNNSDVSASSNTSENTTATLNDLFGFELIYNNTLQNGATILNSQQWNGNISAMKWSSNQALGAVKDVAYTYSYDALNRITGAGYLADNAGTWSNSTGAFSESGYAYDLNGNIKALTRNGSTGSAMDNLTYAYSGNQLLTVTDAADKTKGFIEPTSTTGNDYAYDVNGNMVTDQNKSLTASNAIQYNHLNLPVQVTKSTNEKIVYTYDASGRKLLQQVYNAAGTVIKTTDYDGEFIYQGDTLQFINHEEGRITMKLAPNAANTTASNEYQYHLKDHLGNVRLTFTTKTQTTTNYGAGFETVNQTAEAGSFGTSYQTSKINTVATNAHGGNNSYYLNGGYAGQVGLAKSFSVMPGDVVNIQAYAKYGSPSGTAAVFTSFVSSLLTAFNLPTPVQGEVGTAAAGISTFGNWEIGASGDESKSDSRKVFVTIILFDRNYNFIDVAYAASTGSNNLISQSYTVKQPGYAYLYISNEHPYLMDVYFDDVTMSLTPSAVIQQEDFYPFGLTFNSFSRENSVPNNYLFNQGTGAKKFLTERVLDLGLNVDMSKYRVYDPAIGRWWQVDPKADVPSQIDLTPYNFADDDPILKNDPEGDCPICPILRKMAQQGAKWAARTMKGEIKQVSRQQAVKILEKKGTVYQVEKNSNKAAKALMKEAKPGKQVVRHDGHQLSNGKTGMDHYQLKSGDGSHVNYMKSAAVGAAATAAATTDANAASTNTTGQAEVNPVDAAVDAVSNATPNGAMINQAANAGKSVFGNNAVGNFIDNWINPAGLGKDVMDLTIMGAMMMTSDKK